MIYYIHSHRAQRKFGDRFAKMKFMVHPNPEDNAALKMQYRELIRDGFLDTKTDRNYEFLAASDSQWRDCTCVFFCVKGPGLETIPVQSMS